MIKKVVKDDLVAALQSNNAQRDPVRLAMKYQTMADNPFVFLRGCCHLFYDALPDDAVVTEPPLAWNCGDLHFENFGSYKGDNRLVYFDINDFDEAALAPCSWDLLRLLTSLQTGAAVLRLSDEQAGQIAQATLTAYQTALQQGKALWVERDTASGLIKDLLDSVAQRSRVEFLDKRTTVKDGHRRFKTDGVKAIAATAEQRHLIEQFMQQYAAEQTDPSFFKVIDVACRIAGTGSLGVQRYAVLVHGKGAPDGHYVLDLKEAKPTALKPHVKRLSIKQPVFEEEAHRVVSVQNAMQAVNHAFLQAVQLDNKDYVLKGLQPTEDRVAIDVWGRKLDRLEYVAQTMGRLLAWGQLRASGRYTSATADALVDYASNSLHNKKILKLSAAMAQLTVEQWQVFKAAYEKGAFS